MSRTAVPASFDPFATHPFTNTSGVTPRPPHPQQYGVPIPTSSQHHQSPISAINKPSSVPTAQTPRSPMQLQAPHPHKPNSTSMPYNMNSRQPVFEPFRKDRSSPDLMDVLAKKTSPLKTTKGVVAPIRGGH